ncbi:hypothetical protein [Mycobacterium phage WXIN]|nr:hypothetical protein [Mycobacterium phage WXIN]
MGLDISHGAWRGAYSAFSRWRDELAEAADYYIPKLDPEEQNGRKLVCIDWARWPMDGYYDPPYIPCRIDGTPDPLLLLVAHSDCEGIIQHRFLDALANRLEELLPRVDGVEGFGHIGDYGDKTRTFIEGLRRAIEAGEDLEFH